MKTSLIVIVTVSMFISSLSGCSSSQGACDEQSEAVQYAKALSQNRLDKLYTDIKSFAESGREFHRVESNSQASPEELSDLLYQDILLDGLRSRILLKGCFDHYVILKFNGIYNEQPSSIILSWGEGSNYGKQQLWPN
jgi:hypothetical protein